jgi:hypothetical protein
LTDAESNIFTTLLPASAAIKRRNPLLHKGELFEAVRDYCITEIDKMLTGEKRFDE